MIRLFTQSPTLLRWPTNKESAVGVWSVMEHKAVKAQDEQDEAAKARAQLAAEKDEERKRKHQEVEQEAEAEEDWETTFDPAIP